MISIDTASVAGKAPPVDITTDLLIIGAGPAGMAAALTAAGRGVRVMLVDENPIPLKTMGERLSLKQHFRDDFGLDLPASPRRVISPHMAAIGLAPDSWLLTCERSPYSLATSLTSALGSIASITDQTDAYVVLTLTGSKLREALAKLIPIDLHPRSFQPGDAVQTLAHHIGIILWRLEDVDSLPTFELAVPRSYFSSLREALYESAAEFDSARPLITQQAAVKQTSEPRT